MRSGQALVLVLMVLSVALTVGLSIATRSTNEVKITSAQEESARALEAAEAGLEKALGGTLQGTTVNLTGSGATYVVEPTPVWSNKKEWEVPFQIVEGEVATIDMRNYLNNDAGEKDKIRFCWGTNSAASGPVLAIDLYYEYNGEIKVGKVLLEPVSPARIGNAITSSPWNTANCPSGHKYSKKLAMSNFIGGLNFDSIQMKMFRIRTLFNGSNPEPISIVVQGGSADFGRQGYEYTSVGSAGTSTQKIRGWDLNYDLPTVFDNALFSGTSLNK